MALHEIRFIESIALLVEFIRDRHVNIVSDKVDNFTNILCKEASKQNVSRLLYFWVCLNHDKACDQVCLQKEPECH